MASTRRAASEGRLDAYRRKRDFARTQEPEGARPAAGVRPGTPAPRFVVQRHRARRLHYDVRLELDGVLVSWAVPKGPTLDATARRAAFMVEDHPIEYLEFEGVIPRGEYGGGDVVVWDLGTWEPADAGSADGDGSSAGASAWSLRARRALDAGELHVDLHGEKLRGRFVFVRTGQDGRGRQEWLLLHKRDEFAQDGWDPEDHPESVLSGRTNDEVAVDPQLLWRSDVPAARAAVRLGPVPPVDPDELRALDGLGVTGRWHVHGRELRVTNLDTVLFPARPGEAPVTKRDLLRYAARIAPTLVPYLRQVSDRSGLARLDSTQNAINKTLVAPYSPRPAPGAPVSAPIDWEELDDPQLAPDAYTIRTILDRIAERGDLFAGVLTHPQQLPTLR